LHWTTHGFLDGHRHSSKVIQGFNLIVLDIDEGTTIEQVKTVLEGYTYHLYTTKSHGKVTNKNPNGDDRFRVVIPTSHILKMDADNYKQFMANIHEFLPFETDEQTGEIARKWESADSKVYFYNEGKLFDVLPFIPKTRMCEERKKAIKPIEGVTGIQRWFLLKINEDGNRNNHLFRFGVMLLEGGIELDDAEMHVEKLNELLDDPIDDERLRKTVFKSMARHSIKKGDT